MALFNNGLDSPASSLTRSKGNYMSSHHNESQPQPQYEGMESNKSGHENGNGGSSFGTVAKPVSDYRFGVTTAHEPVPAQPVWDRERRELRLGKTLVKRFKWPAENQERVLNAFQDNGWPKHIQDPLEQHPDICPKRRLHDTLKCLNRKQINAAIKFRGDGTGLGVLLEIVPEAVKVPRHT